MAGRRQNFADALVVFQCDRTVECLRRRKTDARFQQVKISEQLFDGIQLTVHVRPIITQVETRQKKANQNGNDLTNHSCQHILLYPGQSLLTHVFLSQFFQDAFYFTEIIAKICGLINAPPIYLR